jgi:hypothetical protein
MSDMHSADKLKQGIMPTMRNLSDEENQTYN